jgi:hypothetical protein
VPDWLGAHVTFFEEPRLDLISILSGEGVGVVILLVSKVIETSWLQPVDEKEKKAHETTSFSKRTTMTSKHHHLSSIIKS